MSGDSAAPTEWIEPEMGTYGPRKAVVSRQGALTKRAVFAWLFIVLVGGSLLANRSINRLNDLYVHGVAVDGIIVDEWETHGKSHGYHFRFEYKFNGVEYEDTVSVNYDTYSSTPLGAHHTVTVLPSDPWSHRYGTVTQQKVDSWRTTWIIGTLLLAGISQAGYLAVLAQIRRETKILSTYYAVPGIVTEIGEATKGKAPTQKLSFRMRMPDGALLGHTFVYQVSYVRGRHVGEQLVLMANPEKDSDITPLYMIRMAELSADQSSLA